MTTLIQWQRGERRLRADCNQIGLRLQSDWTQIAIRLQSDWTQRPYEALRCTQMHSDALRCNQMQSDAIKGAQRHSAHLSSNPRSGSSRPACLPWARSWPELSHWRRRPTSRPRTAHNERAHHEITIRGPSKAIKGPSEVNERPSKAIKGHQRAIRRPI